MQMRAFRYFGFQHFQRDRRFSLVACSSPRGLNMASTWSRVWWTSLARARNSDVSRLATLVFVTRHAGTRTFYSQQQHHGQRVLGDGARKLLTCTAFISAAGLGYALHNWKDDIRQGFKVLAASNHPPDPEIPLTMSDCNQKRDRFNFIADAVEVSAPSVVYIEIKDGNRMDYFTGRAISVSNGSGFIIREDGLILTNAHVVMNRPSKTTRINVRLHDGSTYTGIIEDIDLESDLATVRINKTNLPVMKLGTSANIRPGEFVVAIGSPLTLSNTITSGIVSSVNRRSQELGMNNRNMELIQTDAAITFGNSGGPLVNLNGEAIGINSMKVASGISFAIPIDYAKEFLKKSELRRKSKDVTLKEAAKRRYMGITMQTLTSEILSEMQQYHEYMNVQHGVLVWKVMIGSPAYSAGLLPGDVITHANGEQVLSSSNIYKILDQPGIIKLQILRKGQILHIVVEPEDVY